LLHKYLHLFFPQYLCIYQTSPFLSLPLKPILSIKTLLNIIYICLNLNNMTGIKKDILKSMSYQLLFNIFTTSSISCFLSLSIKFTTEFLTSLPSYNTPYISLVIGIVTLYLIAKLYADLAVLTPSTTIPTLFVASSRLFPSPIKIPALLFLLCILVQVTIKSPIPERPAKVSLLAPILLPNLDISIIPLVISAAFVLSP